MTSIEEPDNIGGADIHRASELEGCKVVFTGRLSEVTRSEVKTLVENHGGKVTNNISRQSDVLVVGENPGTEKIEFLDDHDISTLTEAEFYSLFPSRFDDVDGVTASKPAQSTLPDDELGTLTIEIEPLVLQVAKFEAENKGEKLNSLIERSTRGLLKQVIDGEPLRMAEFNDRESLDISLPQNLLAMVETAVETTPRVETAEEFVVRALHSELGFEASEMQELTLTLPGSIVSSLNYLSEAENDCDVNELAVQLLYTGLPERFKTE
ncbi:BRCT domain-containing protein [Halorussus litoreus]|uniref:BRCT domain-containing protein n=1 Tax=Halorussus litoreus TaxID=1710536 RepID=UPI000E280E74|nr:BRCT domain-containing protein [Halorussus litoreus]